MQVVKTLIKKNKQDFTHASAGLHQRLGDAIERDLGSFVRRIAIGAGADGRKADRPRTFFLSQFQTFVIATGKLGGLAVLAIPVNWADSMDHMLGGKCAGRGHNSAARWTAAGASAKIIQLAHDS